MSDHFDDIIAGVLGIRPPNRGSGSMFDVSSPEAAPGLLVPGNINIHRRPTVRNGDGSYSTVRSMSFTDDNGRSVVIPTVIEGRGVVSPTEAINYYRTTGQHLGMFASPEDADAYAQGLHEQQAQEYGDGR